MNTIAQNQLLLNILAIAFVIVIGSVAYILAHPDMRLKIARAVIADSPFDDMIQKCIADSWKMHAEIIASTSKAELEANYFEVEHFEAAYTGLVPDSFLKQQTDRLYEAVAQRRDQLRSGVKVAFS
jgi:hypothetical protein